jgi:selenocysteine lyase/cysteine desulfurase
MRPGFEQRLCTTREGGTGSVSEQDRQPEFMPDRFEAGSHNAIGIIGLLEGVKWVVKQTVEKLAQHERALSKAFLDRILDQEGITCYGPRNLEDRTAVFSIRIEGFEPYELANLLESEYGVLTRPGLHCAPGVHGALGTLQRGGTTRFSFGPFLTVKDVTWAADAVVEVARTRSSKAFAPST